MDRAMFLWVAFIPENERKKETDTEAAFDAMHLEVLGALLDGLSRGLAGVPRPAAMGAALALAPPGGYEADRQFISDDLVADAMLFDVHGPAGTGPTSRFR
jgi:hypothetical protein